jgi:hypothetical protein
VDSRAELGELSERLKAAGEKTLDEEAVSCCYAKGDKTWVNDPAGVRWETFYTFGDATTYGEDAQVEVVASGAACCGTAAKSEPAQQTTKAGGCCA